MKKIMKVMGIGLLIAVGGLLVFGAINRTLAKGIESETDEFVAEIEEIDYGKGNGGSGFGYAGSNEGVLTATPIPDDDSQIAEVIQDSTLEQNEIDGLLYMVEEEKLARDVYLYLANLWGMPVFSNIAASEQTHMDAIITLIARYGLENPVSSQTGVFGNPDLQTLYDQLIAQGSLSVEEALKVGAAIEEIDILDLQERIAETGMTDIQLVYQNLESGSNNHLNAFVSNLEGRTGVIYEPQYLNDEAYLMILSDTATTGIGYGVGGQGNRGGNH